MPKRIIHFTAYTRPHGKTERRSWVLHLPDKESQELVERKLADIKSAGLEFTYEDLGNGTSNVCLENKKLAVPDYDSRVCRTSPAAVKELVYRMLVIFDIKVFDTIARRKEGE